MGVDECEGAAHVRVHGVLKKNKKMWLPRELWIMVLEWKRKWAWAERKEKVWRQLRCIEPVRMESHVELGLSYFITANVMFIVEVPDVWDWEDRDLMLIIHQNIRWPAWERGKMFKVCPSSMYSE